MRLFWLNFLAVIITAVSFQVIDQRCIDYHSVDQIGAISGVATWDLNPLKEADHKSSLKQHYIAQDFIPIVTIASSYPHSKDFVHYLPIYNLTREKNYFLLI